MIIYYLDLFLSILQTISKEDLDKNCVSGIQVFTSCLLNLANLICIFKEEEK